MVFCQNGEKHKKCCGKLRQIMCILHMGRKQQKFHAGWSGWMTFWGTIFLPKSCERRESFKRSRQRMNARHKKEKRKMRIAVKTKEFHKCLLRECKLIPCNPLLHSFNILSITYLWPWKHRVGMWKKLQRWNRSEQKKNQLVSGFYEWKSEHCIAGF